MVFIKVLCNVTLYFITNVHKLILNKSKCNWSCPRRKLRSIHVSQLQSGNETNVQSYPSYRTYAYARILDYCRPQTENLQSAITRHYAHAWLEGDVKCLAINSGVAVSLKTMGAMPHDFQSGLWAKAPIAPMLPPPMYVQELKYLCMLALFLSPHPAFRHSQYIWREWELVTSG